MKKVLFSVAALTAAVLIPTTALAHHKDGHPNPGNPHGEEADGCDHGATGKPCKDDPQPDKGKDCEVHGKHGGINEDHCNNETPPTTEPPTTPPTTTPPTTPPTTQPPTTPPTTQPPTDPGPEHNCVTPEGFPFSAKVCPEGQDNPDPQPQPTPGPDVVTATPDAPPVDELAHTGVGSLMMGGIGGLSLLMGTGLRMFGKRR